MDEHSYKDRYSREYERRRGVSRYELPNCYCLALVIGVVWSTCTIGIALLGVSQQLNAVESAEVVE